MDHSDGELIKRILAGDEAAFGALVDRYKGASSRTRLPQKLGIFTSPKS